MKRSVIAFSTVFRTSVGCLVSLFAGFLKIITPGFSMIFSAPGVGVLRFSLCPGIGLVGYLFFQKIPLGFAGDGQVWN